MEVYILKSAACLAILFIFYKLVLENTALHSTKRVYLLASLIISLLIPFITFTQYVEVVPVTQLVSEGFIFPMENSPIINEPINYLPYILGAVYVLGALFFGFRFAKNLYSLVQKIKHNPIYKEKSIWYVLLKLPVTPHSFFNYIFFDKEAYEAGTIPEEVLVHEQAHVTQKHSWDILFFEIFQIAFWFNPLLFFFKRSIKLNHEFLADRTVLQTGAELATYQNILLDFSSKSSVPAMAHSINYSSIKKRFNVMKTRTSKRAAWLKGLLIVPVLAVLIYGFSETKQEFITSEIGSNQDNGILNITISEKEVLSFNGKTISFNEISKELNGKKYKQIDINASSKISIPFGRSLIKSLNDSQVCNTISYKVYDDPTGLDTNYMEHIWGYDSKDGKKIFALTIKENVIFLNGEVTALSSLKNEINDITRGWSLDQYTGANPNFLVTKTTKAFLNKVNIEFSKADYSIKNNGITLKQYPSHEIPTNTKRIEVPKTILTGKAKNYIKPKHPTYEDLVRWQYAKKFRLFLDGKQISNEKILDYNPADLPFYEEKTNSENELTDVSIWTSPYWQDKIGMHDGIKEAFSNTVYKSSNINNLFKLQIELSKLRLNGVTVKLKNFANTVDKLTKDWEETDYTSIKPQVFVAATPKAFLDKVDAEFRKTHFSKANGGMDIVPPPPPPAPPKVSKGEKSNIPPPPPPPIATESNVGKDYPYSYSLYVNGKTIYLNGKEVSLGKFAKAMDKHTKNWPVSAFKKFGVSTKKENTSDDFIEKLNTEYRKTQLAKNSSSKNPYLFSEMETGFIPTPPTPPEKKNPINHIIAMAKRNASFYYEMIEIKSDRAISLVKNNPNLKIQTRLNDPNPPKVYISNPVMSFGNSNLKNYTIASVKALKGDEIKTGKVYIKGETYFFLKVGENISYHDKWGNLVNENGESISTFQKEQQKLNESGFLSDNKSALSNVDKTQNTIKVNTGNKTIKSYNFANNINNPSTAINIISNYEERRAKFSFNGKSITVDEAKEILNDNPDYGITVTEYLITLSLKPEVEIVPN